MNSLQGCSTKDLAPISPLGAGQLGGLILVVSLAGRLG